MTVSDERNGENLGACSLKLVGYLASIFHLVPLDHGKGAGMGQETQLAWKNSAW